MRPAEAEEPPDGAEFEKVFKTFLEKIIKSIIFHIFRNRTCNKACFTFSLVWGQTQIDRKLIYVGVAEDVRNIGVISIIIIKSFNRILMQ